MNGLIGSFVVGLMLVAIWIWTAIEGGKDEPWPTEED